VIDVGPEGFELVEIAEGVTPDMVAAATDGPLTIPEMALPTF
jgi:3-oxoacid CoA-transferase subunit B